MLPAARPASNILSHWYSLYESGQFSSSVFYDSVEAELKSRKLPHLKSSRPEFHEGGFASDKRVYLRLERERYAFDVCAAPFGTGYFFSLRLVEKPRSWLSFIAALFLLLAANGMSDGRPGFFTYAVLAIAVIMGIVYFANSVSHPNKEEPFDSDSFILNMAIVGPLYERARADTYYRYDTRLLFQSVVADVVKRKVAEVTAQNGVSLLEAYDYSPLLGGTYKAVKIGGSRNDD